MGGLFPSGHATNEIIHLNVLGMFQTKDFNNVERLSHISSPSPNLAAVTYQSPNPDPNPGANPCPNPNPAAVIHHSPNPDLNPSPHPNLNPAAVTHYSPNPDPNPDPSPSPNPNSAAVTHHSSTEDEMDIHDITKDLISDNAYISANGDGHHDVTGTSTNSVNNEYISANDNSHYNVTSTSTSTNSISDNEYRNTVGDGHNDITSTSTNSDSNAVIPTPVSNIEIDTKIMSDDNQSDNADMDYGSKTLPKGNRVTQIIQKWSSLTDLYFESFESSSSSMIDRKSNDVFDNNDNPSSSHPSGTEEGEGNLMNGNFLTDIKSEKNLILQKIKIDNRNLDLLSILRNYSIREGDP